MWNSLSTVSRRLHGLNKWCKGWNGLLGMGIAIAGIIIGVHFSIGQLRTAQLQVTESAKEAVRVFSNLTEIVSNLQKNTKTLDTLPGTLGHLTNIMTQFDRDLVALRDDLVANLGKIAALQQQTLAAQTDYLEAQKAVWDRGLQVQERQFTLQAEQNARMQEQMVETIALPYRMERALLENLQSDVRANLELIGKRGEEIFTDGAYQGIQRSAWQAVALHEWRVPGVPAAMEPIFVVCRAMV